MYRVAVFASLALATMSLCVQALANSGLAMWGTGFVVDRQGHVLTARHVVNGCDHVEIVGQGIREAAAVTAISPSDDLAVLQVGRPFGTPLAFESEDRIASSAMVTVLGYETLATAAPAPDGRLLMSNGLLLTTPSDRLTLISDAKPGASGSPVIDRTNHVVGVLISMRLVAGGSGWNDGPRETHFAVSATAAQRFLQQSGVSPPVASDASAGDRAPVVALAAAEIKVECYQGEEQSVLGWQSP